MNVCTECGHVFDEPATITDLRDWGETTVADGFLVCPQCKGEFEPAHQCEDCGEYFTQGSLDNGLCAPCKQQRRIEAMGYLNAGLKANYDEREARKIRSIIEAATDGEELFYIQDAPEGVNAVVTYA